jgi:heme-degrading monooxygenase HmoA
MTTVETIRFKLRDGISDDDFRRRNHQVETEYMAKRPGFIARETTRSDEGEYLVIVHWASAEDAEKTIAAFFGAPQTQSFIAAVDVSTVSSGRYTAVQHP